ncbi:DUF4150 domain-containing protein [Jannaschia sp. CCS1]|uniref:DUF4150 domain-containing protein n=1 Tax=Jannaschia sp. (strain CCS1) TaxID=290400 RepID=UPI000053DD59|nr:DUF4150 domain-containing protein [Jannaschia sp. CCS1]ABD55932.1 hypothetical protein Jann_3015 [Jannaschia sp. CCS1]
MTVTIRVNGLTITHRGSGGQHANSTPDVCRTPGKGRPVPYSITAVNPDIVKGTTTVSADGGNMIANRPSEFSTCTGDAPGSMNGVSSGTHLAQSNWITYSPNVYMEGQNVCRLTDKLFMNNYNAMSGQTGQIERVFDTGDPVLDALCEIFCEVREEWQECRRNPPSRGCRNPSLSARDRTRAALGSGRSRLDQNIRGQYGSGATGASERGLFVGRTAADARAMGRRPYDERGMRNFVERQVRQAIRDNGLDALRRGGRRMWMRLVPGLNILGGVLDVIDLATTGADIYNAVRQANLLEQNAVRVVPDVTILDADGNVADIYDYKFDAPGYQDSFSQDQMDLYEDRTDIGGVNEVSNETCECDTSPTRPSRGLS